MSVLLFTVPSKAILHWKGQKLKFQKKICGLRNNKPITFRKKKKKKKKKKKIKKGKFKQNYF